MTTHFIEAEIDLQETPLTVKQVEETLQQQGEPLRWAITEVDKEKETAKVEAIVTSKQ
ncbi:hypothetical protein [Crocosphaera sp.]|uniref:hypothetical protein n=1 Tax=Crocosphaera sp. TaxID=2729996 RepID=UPI0026150D9A|nr:hypothetical protein [Crocosphaera sp.]MDJ0582327.1 hypothetical protein [Crocosphaera sp.]